MVYAGQYVSYIKYDQGALEPYLSWYPEYKSTSSEQLYPTLYYHRDYCSIPAPARWTHRRKRGSESPVHLR